MTESQPQQGEVWKLSSRNLEYAVYTAKYDDPTHGLNWIGLRTKFDNTSLDQSEIFVRPIEKIGQLKESRIRLEEYIGLYDGFTGRPLRQVENKKLPDGRETAQYLFVDQPHDFVTSEQVRVAHLYNWELHRALDRVIADFEATLASPK